MALLSLELDYVSKRRATAAEYDAKALAKHILARYVGQARSGSCHSRDALLCRTHHPGIIVFWKSWKVVGCRHQTIGHHVNPLVVLFTYIMPRDTYLRRCFRWTRSW